MRIAVFAAVYFLAVFAVGFGLGVVRIVWVVPAIGERIAEVAEMPFMIAASVLLGGLFVVSRSSSTSRAATPWGARPTCLRGRVYVRAGRRRFAVTPGRPPVTDEPSRYARRFAAGSFSIA